jgi:hypothetical protein
MSLFGGEKMSRVIVGIFLIVIIVGFVGFFTGSFDSIIGTHDKSSKISQEVPAKLKAPTSSDQSVARPVKLVPAIANKETLPLQKPSEVIPKPELKNRVVSEPNIVDLAAASAVTATHGISSKKIPVKQARPHDLDLRNCLELGSNRAIIQCAYQ